MTKYDRTYTQSCKGSVLGLVLIVMIILALVGAGLLKISHGASIQAVKFQNETISMLAAEAGYEKAVYWMTQRPDLLMELDLSGTSGTIEFENSRADYQVQFYDFVGFRPVFEVVSNGYCGTYQRSIRVYVTQAISGWEMGMCRVPSGTSSTAEVNFADGEIIDMPIHINSYGDPEDWDVDIHLSGDPLFLQPVSMSESRYSSGGKDKYSKIINRFDTGIYFNQPESMITDQASFVKKMNWYKKILLDQNKDMIFKPKSHPKVKGNIPAVQLEFFVNKAGRGCVRITDDCPVVGYMRSGGNSSTWDYKVQSNGNSRRYEKYDIYGYHYISEDAEKDGLRFTEYMDDLLVTPSYGGVDAPACGMIYVDGNVIIGSKSESASESNIAMLNTVQGTMVVVATGNIWMANSLVVSDRDDEGNTYPRQDNGMPGLDNPNAIGLVSLGVIKVIDPGVPELLRGTQSVNGLDYEPVGDLDSRRSSGSYHRHLPDPMVVECALTVGGGGWGAENVQRGRSGGRKDTSRQDDLVLRGTITEVIRGVVGLIGSDGFLKHYYFDQRILSGIVPGAVRLKGKFVTTPSGWEDYRVDPKPQEE